MEVMGANLSSGSQGRPDDDLLSWLDPPPPKHRRPDGGEPVRLRLFLTLMAALALVVASTVIIFNQFSDDGSGGPTRAAATSTTLVDTDGDGATLVPAAGQVRLSGTVTAIHLEGALLQPRTVPAPLTISSDRGFGNGGEITGLSVEGKPASIVWDGGRPFVLSSGKGLVLDPVTVDLVPDGLRLLLGGASHALVPGSYQLDTPVAVGTTGIATPRDSVTFNAPQGARFEAHGDASMLLGKDSPEHRFAGPGKVHLEGDLAVVDENGRATSATDFDLAEGRFDLTFSPDDDGRWTIVGIADHG
jgi:hypothetical protein